MKVRDLHIKAEGYEDGSSAADLLEGRQEFTIAIRRMELATDQETWERAGRLYTHGKPGLQWLWEHECQEVRRHFADIVLGFEDAMS